MPGPGMKGWFIGHATAFASAVGRLARHPVAALFEVLVLGIALALPVALYVAVDALRGFAGRHPTDPEISVFLAIGTPPVETAVIGSRLHTLPAVATVEFVPRQQAYAALRKTAALAEVLDALPENPLPDAYLVRLSRADPDTLERMRGDIAGWPRVAAVQVDSAWARKVDAAVRVARASGLILAALFAAAVVAIIFNTTRLQMLNRRREIELMRLIGATFGYIRRPYVYFGGLQGFFGAAAALGLTAAGLRHLADPLAEFSTAYGTSLTTEPLSPLAALGFLGASASLGAIAAWLAASRHLWAHGLRDEDSP